MPGRRSGNVDQRRNVFGLALKRLRVERELTIPQLIARIQRSGWDVGEDTITNIELGRRILSDAELVLILRALDCSLKDLRMPPK